MANQPRPTTPTPHRLLGIWAHPDDEAYLSAGLMAQTIAAGGHVTLVTLTDGEMGFPADDPRSTGARAEHRRAELLAAMATIGVDDIRFLGIADGEVANTPAQPVVSTLTDIIAEIQPDTIVTFGPDGITGHEDHVANSQLVTSAWLAAGAGELLYAAKTPAWLDEWSEIHAQLGVLMTDESTISGSVRIHHTIDLAGADLALKREVLAAHASQTEMVASFFGEPDYLRWIGQESFRKPTHDELLATALADVQVTSELGPTEPATATPATKELVSI